MACVRVLPWCVDVCRVAASSHRVPWPSSEHHVYVWRGSIAPAVARVSPQHRTVQPHTNAGEHISIKAGFGFRVTSGTHKLLLSAPSLAVRDEWCSALQQCVCMYQRPPRATFLPLTCAVDVAAIAGFAATRAAAALAAGTHVVSHPEAGEPDTPPSAPGSSWLWGSRKHGGQVLKFLRPALQATGVLRVRVISAEHLWPKDASGTSDPYVVVRVGKAEARTKVVKKCLSPEWNETFEFPFSRRTRFVRVDMFDHDLVGKHDFLGRCLIPVSHVTDTPCQEWYDITSVCLPGPGK